MSGHSKWANIRVRKGAQDARRGKIYTKYARLIEIAAREGGSDPVSNIRLRTLIESARADSVPNANIERAIKKGSGALKGEAQMEEIVYEGYGPEGIAFIIECLSDNKNRTLSNVKNILSKCGGRFAASGSVLWMFHRRGFVLARQKNAQVADEDLALALIELGAEDIEQDGAVLRIVSSPHHWPAIRDFLQGKGCVVEIAEARYMPETTIHPDEDIREKVHALIEALEADDDVSEVRTNMTLLS